MLYRFHGFIIEEGKRFFIKIPFNVWDETGLKGNIPCKVSIHDFSFECKLLPKGKGIYFIPIMKKMLSILKVKEEYEIEMEVIATLSRINHDSPYSKEHPIRKIDGIVTIPVQKGYCGQGCVAMLAGVSLFDVVKKMGKGHASWSKIIEALDYYGIAHSKKMIYTKGKQFALPRCCIINHDHQFIIWYKGSFYNGTEVDLKKILNYLEIFVDE